MSMSMQNAFINRTEQTQSSKDKDLSNTDIKYLCAHVEKKHEIMTCTKYEQNPNQNITKGITCKTTEFMQ